MAGARRPPPVIAPVDFDLVWGVFRRRLVCGGAGDGTDSDRRVVDGRRPKQLGLCVSLDRAKPFDQWSVIIGFADVTRP